MEGFCALLQLRPHSIRFPRTAGTPSPSTIAFEAFELKRVVAERRPYIVLFINAFARPQAYQCSMQVVKNNNRKNNYSNIY